MKINMVRKFYSPEPASGGGAAVATPPAAAPAAPSAPAAAPAAPAAPARSMFGLPVQIPALKVLPGSKTPDGQAPAAAAPTKEQRVDVSRGQDGKWRAKDSDTGAEIGTGFDSQESAVAYLKSMETTKDKPSTSPTPAAATTFTPDTPLPTPIYGRFKTIRETEDGFRRSEQEGIRLFQENKALKEQSQKALADREAQLAALRAELETARTTPAFKELTKEELEALSKDNPLAAQDYLVEKKFRDRDAQARKEAAARDAQDREFRQAKMLKAIEAEDIEMRAKKDEYPQYEEMIPVMDAIIDKTRQETPRGKLSPLTGHAWSTKVLYRIALGEAYLQALKTAKGMQTDAKDVAQRTAEAGAVSTAAGAGDTKGSGAVVTDPAAKADAEYKAALLASGQRPRFLANRQR